MKKLLLCLFLVGTTLTAFGADKLKVLKVGASPVPHAEILKSVKEDLKAKGIDLQIIELTDYVTPNILLADKQLDANYFQHVPYLTEFAKEKKLALTALPPVHVEPMALYANKVKDINSFKEGATIAIPNDPSNGGRALILLHEAKIITLKDPKNLLATEKDIIANPKKLKIKALEAAQLPRVLRDIDGAVINGNYAIEAGLNPVRDAILIEGANSPYANIVTVRTGDENRPEIKLLNETLRSPKVKKFIADKYNGGVVAAF